VASLITGAIRWQFKQCHCGKQKKDIFTENTL